MLLKKEIEEALRKKDKIGAKYALSAISRRFRDWEKILDEYYSLKGPKKKEFKKDPLNCAVIDEYEEINPYVAKLQELENDDNLRKTGF